MDSVHPNYSIEGGYSLLMAASHAGCIPLMEALINAGAKPDGAGREALRGDRTGAVAYTLPCVGRHLTTRPATNGAKENTRCGSEDGSRCRPEQGRQLYSPSFRDFYGLTLVDSASIAGLSVAVGQPEVEDYETYVQGTNPQACVWPIRSEARHCRLGPYRCSVGSEHGLGRPGSARCLDQSDAHAA